MAIDLYEVSDEVIDILIADNYEKTKQMIIDEGTEGNYYITLSDFVSVIDDSIYLTTRIRNWGDNEHYIQKPITPYELYFLTILIKNKERIDD